MNLDFQNSQFDAVVIGGGSAGVVIASRLSEDASLSVLLIEAGEDYEPGREPAAIRDTFHTAVYRAENMWPGLNVFWGAAAGAPRRYEQARVMGGGSSVNAMAAIRGLSGDYDEWEAAGAQGWNWNAVLPYFIRLETDTDFSGAGHGRNGPISIRRNRRENWPPFTRAAAGVLAAEGYPYIDDLNLDFRDGLCSVPVNSVATHRVSVATGYLSSEVRARKNLTILPRAYATAIRTEGKRITGVTARMPDGSELQVSGRNVVVTAGSLHTPALLMRAGIGPGAHLQSLGIPVTADLPGVGENLQDHPALAVAAHLKRHARQSAAWRPAPNVSLRYSSNYPGCAPSDCWLSLANKTTWHALGQRIAALGISVYKPYSRGVVRLRSSSPMDEPHVEFRMLSDQRDLARMQIGLRKAVALMTHPEVSALTNHAFVASFSERIRDLNRVSRRNWARALLGTIALDGPAPVRKWLIENVVAPKAGLETIQDEKPMTDWIRASTTGFYHPVGTCKMGQSSDRLAVANHEGRVFGVENLYVGDASLMPSIVRANTNIPTIMMAEKLSDALKRAVKGKVREAECSYATSGT